MGVSKRIEEALDKLNTDDMEGALIPICIALSATAARVYPNKRDGDAYKLLLACNMNLMMQFTFGNNVNIRTCFSHPDLKPGLDGLVSMEQILYHVVRCGLIHNAKITDNLSFTKENYLVLNGKDNAIFPVAMLYALIFIVLTSPVNSNEHINGNYRFIYKNNMYSYNDFWGNESLVKKLVQDSVYY